MEHITVIPDMPTGFMPSHGHLPASAAVLAEPEPTHPKILKLITYKGAVMGRWKAPRTRRQTLGSMKKLIRFYYRCKQSNILTTEMAGCVKDCARALIRLSELMGIQDIELEGELTRISLLDTAVEAAGITEVSEKVREHAGKEYCSICTTKLVYPAYVIKRHGVHIISKSRPVGIICLNNAYGKLKDLTAGINGAVESLETCGAIGPVASCAPKDNNIQGLLFS